MTMKQINTLQKLLLTFGFLGCLAMAGNPSSVHASDTVSIPEKLGWVSGQHLPAAESAQGQLYLLEDAHFNLEAHQNIAAIIKLLSEIAAVRTILVEGAEEQIDGGYVQKFASSETITAIADDLLRQGKITGDVYADMTSDYDLQLHSIDDPDLYIRNVDAFIEVKEVRESIGPVVEEALQQSHALAKQVFSEPLHQLETKRREFAEDQISVSEYAQYLSAAWSQAEGSLATYPQIANLAGLNQTPVDPALLAEEQRRAIQYLSQHSDPQPMQQLTAVAQALKAGERTKDDFYRAIDQALEQTGANRDHYPELQKHFDAINNKKQLDAQALLNEIREMQQKLRAQLASTASEQALVNAIEALEAYRRLLDLKWSPDIYERYIEKRAGWQFTQWVPELQSQMRAAGFDWKFPADPANVDAQLQKAVAFYVLANERNQSMVRNTISRLNVGDNRSAVMVVGGFHSDELAKLLAQEGYAVTLITPRVGDTPMSDSYEDAMKDQFLTNLKRKPVGTL